jgi:hypothetical protein
MPTDECIVLGIYPSEKYGVTLDLRDMTTRGQRTAVPSAVTVAGGNSKKSHAYRMEQDESFRVAEKEKRK